MIVLILILNQAIRITRNKNKSVQKTTIFRQDNLTMNSISMNPISMKTNIIRLIPKIQIPIITSHAESILKKLMKSKKIRTNWTNWYKIQYVVKCNICGISELIK